MRCPIHDQCNLSLCIFQHDHQKNEHENDGTVGYNDSSLNKIPVGKLGDSVDTDSQTINLNTNDDNKSATGTKNNITAANNNDRTNSVKQLLTQYDRRRVEQLQTSFNDALESANIVQDEFTVQLKLQFLEMQLKREVQDNVMAMERERREILKRKKDEEETAKREIEREQQVNVERTSTPNRASEKVMIRGSRDLTEESTNDPRAKKRKFGENTISSATKETASPADTKPFISSTKAANSTSSISSVSSITKPSKKAIAPVKDYTFVAPQKVLPFAPATHDQRSKFLTALNKEIKQNVPNIKLPNLITMSLEHQIASSCKTTASYINNFKGMFVKVKRKEQTMIDKILEMDKRRRGLSSSSTSSRSSSSSSSSTKQLNDGTAEKSSTKAACLLSKEEYLQRLEKLIHPVELLEKHHYVVRVPNEGQETSESSTVAATLASHGNHSSSKSHSLISNKEINFKVVYSDTKDQKDGTARIESTIPGKSVLKHCQRCNTLFDISTSISKNNFQGICRFHSGKKTPYTDKNNKRYFVWQCCQQGATSRFDMNDDYGNSEAILGCEELDFHVYKLDDVREMHRVLPFKETWALDAAVSEGSGGCNATGSKSSGNDDNSKIQAKYKVVGLDAEMVFTTLGFELARITIIDFFAPVAFKKATTTDTAATNDNNNYIIVYDKLVRPKGQVLDYNTKFSGISQINEHNSISYEQFLQELNEIMDSSTIFIGHGLENDMNVMRLIHHRIIDTALLFNNVSDSNGAASSSLVFNKYRTGNVFKKAALKLLSERFLKRKIQTGEHDSAEDSIAAIDLVKWFILNILSDAQQ